MAKASSNPVVRPLIKFSVYALACLALLAVLTLRVGNLRGLPFTTHDHTYYAEMTDASSLVPPDDVKIAGVTVGQVKGLKVRHGMAVVKFVVDRKVVLRQSTQVGMRYQNVIGDKFLYLYPGSDGAVMKPGSTIPISNNVESADVGDFLTDIGAFFKALNPNDVNAFTQSIVAALEDNTTQVNSLISNTATVTGTVGGLDAHVASIIANLEQVMAALAARNSDLAGVADHLQSVAAQLAARNDVLDNVISNFANVNAELNQLIGGNRANLDQTISNLQSIANVLSQHHTDLQNGLSTLSAGLEPYTLISSFGQWFEIRVVYACLANQKSCVYEEPGNPPATFNNPPRSSAGSYGQYPAPASASASPSGSSSSAAAAGTGPTGFGAPAAPTGAAALQQIVGFALDGRAGG